METSTMMARLRLIPELLRKQRLSQGLSQLALAEIAGVHVVTLSRIETGAQQASVGTVRRLADALGLQVLDLAELCESE
jgi:transcriptional regulator with XRE-family HTH domain